MKKIRLLSVVTICLFIFSATAFGAQPCDSLNTCPCDPVGGNCGNITVFNNTSEPGCLNCDDIIGGGKTGTEHTCDLGTVPCLSDNDTILYPFDYDGEPYGEGIVFWQRETQSIDGLGNYGYCNTPKNFNDQNVNDPYNPGAIRGQIDRNCKFVFDVCWCPEACYIDEGTFIGVQMIIDADNNWSTTDDGVYFADAPTIHTLAPDTPVNNDYEGRPTVYFSLHENKANLCKEELIDSMQAAPIYLTVGNDIIPYKNEAAQTKFQIRNFGPVYFYRSYSDDITRISQKDYFITRPSNLGIPKPVGIIQDQNRVTVLQSGIPMTNGTVLNVPGNIGSTPQYLDIDSEYMFNTDDVKNITHCFLWVDIPPMRLDHTRVTRGNKIRVKVRFLFHKEKFICENCAPPAICECVLDVATICCGSEPAGERCMYFPYVLQGIQDMGWGSGIAVTATDSMPDNPFCKLTLKDAMGNTATYTKTSVNPIWTFMVDGELANFTGGSSLTPGATSLEIITNYSADGYSFLDGGNFGAGVLPRGCNGNCCPQPGHPAP